MTSIEEELLTCYNKSCGKKFKESENGDDSCLYHSGSPYFHDVYKGWTCCKRTIDFTDFLNLKGCTRGRHSNIKPVVEEKKKEPLKFDIAEYGASEASKKEILRPSEDEPMVNLEKTFSDSLKQKLKQIAEPKPESRNLQKTKSNDSDSNDLVGKQCLHKGCLEKYEGESSKKGTCRYHPGAPVFHEGLKYWSCCNKRTVDFQAFLEQKGCFTGTHQWVEEVEQHIIEGGFKQIRCRYDWHQTASHVLLEVYGKNFCPNTSEIKVNGVKLSIELTFPEKQEHFFEEIILQGIIEPNSSSVLMTPMKTEIKLCKAEAKNWKSLKLEKSKSSNITVEPKNVGVDPLDLSDL